MASNNTHLLKKRYIFLVNYINLFFLIDNIFFSDSIKFDVVADKDFREHLRVKLNPTRDAGKSSYQVEGCRCQPAYGPLRHRVLLRRMQTALPPCIGHGPAPAPGQRVGRRGVDNRPVKSYRIYVGIQKAVAGVDVLLVGPQEPKGTTRRQMAFYVGVSYKSGLTL